MASWSSVHWECLLEERSVSSDRSARKPRQRSKSATQRAKVTPEILAEYTNPEATELVPTEAPSFTKVPAARELSAADVLRAKMVADPSLHQQWFIPALYSQQLPRHVAQSVAASWRRAKPEPFGGAEGSKFEAGVDPSPLEPGTWILKVRYVPAPALSNGEY